MMANTNRKSNRRLGSALAVVGAFFVICCIHVARQSTTLLTNNISCRPIAGGGAVDHHNTSSKHPTSSSNPIRDRDRPKIAMVMRVVNPIRSDILERIVQLSKIVALQQTTTFANYELVLLADETRTNGTAQLLQEYWTRRHLDRLHVRLGMNVHVPPIPMPRIFAITETMIRAEFPALSDGYLGNVTLVNGERGSDSLREAGGRPNMWQLLVPAFVVFFHHHLDRYSHAWAFEDDVGSVGVDSLVELFPKWDDAMMMRQNGNGQDQDIDLAAIRTHANGVPFNLWVRRRQTFEFLAILQALGMSEPPPFHLLTYHQYDWISWNTTAGGAPEWTHEMRSGKRTRPPRNDTDEVLRYRITGRPAPRWTCVSDSFYRHSREFSQYLYKISLAECISLCRVLPAAHGIVGRL